MENQLQDQQQKWDADVAGILKGVRKVAVVYMLLGYVVYGLGSVAIMWFLRDHAAFATAIVMFFFQLCVIYFGTKVIFPNIAGAFRVGLLANRNSMPAFIKLAEIAGDKNNSPLIKAINDAALDIRNTGDTIRQEIAGLKEAMTKPIAPPFKKIVAPVAVETKSAEPAAAARE
jgi:hypothetical protein